MTAESSVQPSGRVPEECFQQPVVDPARWSVGMLLGLLWCAALLLVWRRLAGALSQPLEPGTMFFVGILVGAAAVAIRFLEYYFPLQEKPSRIDWLMFLSPTAAMLALGVALSLPSTPPAGWIAFWSLVAVEEVWAWTLFVRLVRRRGGSPRPVRVDPPVVPSPHPPAADPSTALPAQVSPLDPPAPIGDTDVLQQLTRSQAADGSEELCGWLRAPLCDGQRTTSIHVAFCPPFRKTPVLNVEHLGGPEARIKTAQLFPHGARLDLKLRHVAASPVDVVLQFSARLPGD